MRERGGLTLLLPLSRDPVSPLSALSTLTRVYEEYPVDSVVALPSAGAGVPGYVVEAAGRLRLGFSRHAPVPTDPEPLGSGGPAHLTSMLRGVIGECGACIVAVSPAGRYYAAALAAAGIWARENATVVHVHFYFGPWSGLPYPYTPRRLQPVVVVNDVYEPLGEARNAASREWQLGLARPPGSPAAGYACKPPLRGLPGVEGAPPLRCAVAEAARRLNDARGARALAAPGSSEAACGRLRVRVGGEHVEWAGEADLCRPAEVARLLDGLARAVRAVDDALSRGGGFGPLRSLIPLAGLAPLTIRAGGGGGVLAGLLAEGAVPQLLADTSLVYYGVHNYAWAGLRLAVPECVVVELERRLSETLKNLAPSRRDPWGRARAFTDLAAYLAYRDLRRAPGASLAPSPPLACDVAIPRVDAPILAQYTPATADRGAVEYWMLTGRLTREPVQVSFGSHTWESLANAQPPGAWMPYAYYSLAQALTLLAALAEALAPASLSASRPLLEVEAKLAEPAGGARAFKPPANMLLKPVEAVEAAR